MSDVHADAVREVMISNKQGLHARPVMRFVDTASGFSADISVANLTRGTEPVNGKSAMEMMVLEATQGTVLRICATGKDAEEAVAALEALVHDGFGMAGTDEPG